MTAQLIDGTAIAAKVRAQVAAAVGARVAAGKMRPGLAAVLVGDNPASQVYVRNKRKACAEVGIESFGHELPIGKKMFPFTYPQSSFEKSFERQGAIFVANFVHSRGGNIFIYLNHIKWRQAPSMFINFIRIDKRAYGVDKSLLC